MVRVFVNRKKQISMKKFALMVFCTTGQLKKVKSSDFDGGMRWVTLGLLEDRVVVVVHTETDEEIRIISIRKAGKNEQILFFRNL